MFLARTIALTLAAIATVPFLMSSPASAEVVFYLQREGSPEDTGLADFITDLETYEEQDFEDPALGQVGDSIPQLFFEDGALAVETMGEWAEPTPAKLGSSSEFDAEGRFYGRALIAGISLTATAQDGRAITGIGMWIFDDTRAYDSVYLIQVTETDGAVSETVLENEIGMNPHGHEIEGFFGAISDIGIASVTITSVDHGTLIPLPDLFQTDHWMIAGMPVVEEPAPEPEPPLDIDPNVDPEPDDIDNDADEDEDEDSAENPNAGSRGHHYGWHRTWIHGQGGPNPHKIHPGHNKWKSNAEKMKKQREAKQRKQYNSRRHHHRHGWR